MTEGRRAIRARDLVRGCALLIVLPIAALLTIYGILLILPRAPAPALAVPEGSFAFAALGDAPYSPLEERLFDVVLEDISAHDLQAVVHVGDLFSEVCTDDAYRRARSRLDRLPHPVVYTPGDNEWTDCFMGSPESNPFVRLASLRQIFFDVPSASIGGRTMPLAHQGTDTIHGEFVENARWHHRGITFATVHMVGSANGTRSFSGRTAAQESEPTRRTEAARSWLRETFREATATDADAVVIAFHVYPFFEQAVGSDARAPFEPFLQVLEEEVADFGGPVVGIHGDYHDFIVDGPLVDRRSGRTLTNFTRVQVPGSPAVGWVHVTVTPGTQPRFAFEPRVVPYAIGR